MLLASGRAGTFDQIPRLNSCIVVSNLLRRRFLNECREKLDEKEIIDSDVYPISSGLLQGLMNAN